MKLVFVDAPGWRWKRYLRYVFTGQMEPVVGWTFRVAGDSRLHKIVWTSGQRFTTDTAMHGTLRG